MGAHDPIMIGTTLSMDVGVGNGGRSVIVGSEVEVLLACRSVAGNAIDHGAFSLSIQYKPTNEDDDASAGEFSPRGQSNGRSSYATTLAGHSPPRHTGTQPTTRFLKQVILLDIFFSEKSRCLIYGRSSEQILPNEKSCKCNY